METSAMSGTRLSAGLCLATLLCVHGISFPAAVMAQSTNAAAQPGAQQLPPILVQAKKRQGAPKRRKPASVVAAPPADSPRTTLTVTPASSGLVAGPAPVKEKYQLPQTSEGITAQKIEQTINVVDTADAIKYLPSLFMRKRNYGDNQAVLATRTWGLGSSARTLIYADDILLSTLLGNNNSNASPRWGMVAPEEIQRIDFLYGPFSAMYPGNSIGGVLQITTRTPDKPEFTLKQTEAFQTFDFYKTSNTYRTDQTSVSFGNRWNALSVFISANYQNANSQPLNWITTAGTPAGTTGTIPQLSRTYATANVIGAGGLLHTGMGNVKGKFTLDVTDWLKAVYTVGFFQNNQESRVQSYLRDVNGPTYGGNAAVGGSGFATANFNLLQEQLANAFTLKTDTRGAFDGEFVVTRFDYLTDIQRSPFTVAASGLTFTDVGRVTRLDGTNWTTIDAKGIWRVAAAGQHEVSFGVHRDRYELVNPVYRTPNWLSSIDATANLYTNSLGKTETVAVWVQDAWRFAPEWKLTLGGRWENWRAFDGFNLTTTTNATTGAITGTTTINQPSLEVARFSPKASLSWEPAKDWQVTASVGVANRFPTVTELYQVAATVPGVIVNPNPNLRPEQALATELAIERKFVDGKVRLSLFEDNTSDALISQSNAIPGTTLTAAFTTNVDKVRARGAELAWQKDNVLIDRLELFGSITYVDVRIISDPTFVPTVGIPSSAAVGRRVPNVPEWRTTLGTTYRPTDQWAFTVAGRWQSKTFSTLDNIDTNPNVYQAFDPFVVVDARVQYKVSQNVTLNAGVDNVFNEKYHLFHPFPQRTFVMSGKATF
jgi:iron complex outermembrane receptor protein